MKYTKGKKYETRTVALPENIVDKVIKITSKKFPLRNIHYYIEGVREALIDYIKMNGEFLDDDNKKRSE